MPSVVLKHVRVKGDPVNLDKVGPVDWAKCKHIALVKGGPVDYLAHGHVMMLRYSSVVPGCTGKLLAFLGVRRRHENKDSRDVAIASCGRDCVSQCG